MGLFSLPVSNKTDDLLDSVVSNINLFRKDESFIYLLTDFAMSAIKRAIINVTEKSDNHMTLSKIKNNLDKMARITESHFGRIVTLDESRIMFVGLPTIDSDFKPSTVYSIKRESNGRMYLEELGDSYVDWENSPNDFN
jgi:hypothetical protein